MRVAEVNVLPAKRPCFFGADAGGQAQGDVGVHPGVVSRGQERGCLVHGQALAGPPGLSLRGVDEPGDVAPDQIAGLGVPYRPGQRVVAHRHGGGRVPAGHRGQRLVYVGGGQFAESPGADCCQDRGEDVLVLFDRFGGPAVESFGQPVFCCVPDGVVPAVRTPDSRSPWSALSRSWTMAMCSLQQPPAAIIGAGRFTKASTSAWS